MVLECFSCVLNCGLGCCEAGNIHEFQFQKKSGTEVDEGAVHRKPTHCFLGTVKNSPSLRVEPKNVHVNLFKMNGLNCVENDMLMHQI